MIFEFFKKLFWRADESSRKRKNFQWQHEDEIHSVSKKPCVDFIPSDNYDREPDYPVSESIKMKAISNLPESRNHENTDDKKNQLIKAPMQWTPAARKNITSKNNDVPAGRIVQVQHSQSLRNSTLHKAHQLIDRQKYSEMLLNFVHLDVDRSYLSGNHVGNVRNQSCNSSRSFEQYTLKSQRDNSVLGNGKFEHSQNTDKNSSTDSSECNVSTYIPEVNSLKKELATKDILKRDFMTKLAEKYNKSLEQQTKEAEELKKMTQILAKHNRLTREATLEERLNRSMRLCEAILDEKDLLEEEKLPELDSEMTKKIEAALSSGPGNEVLVQEFGLRITRKDIQTLAGLNWLNDEVINFYMNLLITRGNSDKYPSVYAMNTFFYPKLVSGGHASLKRWTRKVDIFSKDLMVVPVHLGIHWCMSIIDFRNKTIQYFDSMGSPNNKCLQALKQYLHDESIDKKKTPFEFTGWNMECMKDIPQQMNGSDCGVFSCVFAEYICANKTINFSQEDMPYFRNKMVYEILTAQLL